MRVFVTGGAGYIGTKVIEKLLENNIKVRCYDSLVFGIDPLHDFMDNSNFEFTSGDITDYKKVSGSMVDCDTVIHLAAMVFQGGENLKNQIMEVNYNATRNIADICDKTGLKFIYTSTCSNYGKSKEIVNENSPLQVNSPYSESKIKSEKYISNNYPDALILRLATGFGLSKKMRFDLIINELTREAISKGVITVFNPKAWRPSLHIEDIANVIVNSLTKDIKGIYNVGHESMNYQKGDLCNILKDIIPRLKINIVKKGDKRNYKVSFDKIKNDLNFKPKRSIHYGAVEIMKAIYKGEIKNPYDKKYQNLEVYRKYEV